MSALLFLRKYMSFSPIEEEDAPSKLKQFIESSTDGYYKMLVALIILLVISVAVGRIFSRLPYVCFAASMLPALQVAFMFEKRAFFQLQAFMIILVSLHVIGNIAECVIRDREDGRHRLWLTAKISSVAGAALCFFIIRITKQPVPENTEELSAFNSEILLGFTELDASIMSKLFWMFAVLLAVSLVLYNVYFIDAVISIIPFAYATHAMISGNLLIMPSLFFTAAAVCTATHICLALMENNLSRKEQQSSVK